MIFRWLYIKRLKKVYNPYLPKEELNKIFSEASLSEWSALRYFINPGKNKTVDLRLSPDAEKKFQELVEISRQKQHGESTKTIKNNG